MLGVEFKSLIAGSNIEHFILFQFTFGSTLDFVLRGHILSNAQGTICIEGANQSQPHAGKHHNPCMIFLAPQPTIEYLPNHLLFFKKHPKTDKLLKLRKVYKGSIFSITFAFLFSFFRSRGFIFPLLRNEVPMGDSVPGIVFFFLTKQSLIREVDAKEYFSVTLVLPWHRVSDGIHLDR